MTDSILLNNSMLGRNRIRPRHKNLALGDYESISQTSNDGGLVKTELKEKFAQISDACGDDLRVVENFIKANYDDFYDHLKAFKKNERNGQDSKKKRVDLSKIRKSKLLVRRAQTEPSSPGKNDQNIFGEEFDLEYDGTYMSIYNILTNQRYTLTLKEFLTKVEIYFDLFHKNSNLAIEELTATFKRIIGYSTFPNKHLICEVFLTPASLLNTDVKVSHLYAYIQKNYREKDFRRLRASIDRVQLPPIGMIANRRNIALDIPVNLLTVQDRNLSKLQMHFRREAASRIVHCGQKSRQKPHKITDFLKSLYFIFLRLMSHFYEKKSNLINAYTEKINKQLPQVSRLSAELLNNHRLGESFKFGNNRLVSPKRSMLKAGNLSQVATNVAKFNQILNRNYGVLSECCQNYLKNFRRIPDLSSPKAEHR